MIIFSQLMFRRLNFVQIFFVIREKALRSFWGIWGHIDSNFGQKGQKLRKKAYKGQILIFFESRQIIPENEALRESFSKNLMSGSKKVIKGQKYDF